MMRAGDECYFVHDHDGRILAIVPRATQRTEDGAEIGVRPEALPGQSIVEGSLPDHTGDLNELLQTHDLRVDLASGQVIVQPRTEGSA